MQLDRKKIKWAFVASDTHSLMFTNVKVPKANRIGEDGFGFKFAMKTLAGGRIGIASQALGIASGAYELALAYSKERKAFGKEISNTRPFNLNWQIWQPELKPPVYFA